MPQIVKPHTCSPGCSTISELARQPDEHDMYADLMRCPSPDRHEQVVACGAELCPGCEIGLESLTGRWLQGDQALLAELAVADDQAVFDQIVALQRQGFGNPQTGRRQQPKQVMIGEGADPALGRKIERRLHDRPDLFRFDDVRRWSRTLPPAKHIGGRNLVSWILGMGRSEEHTSELQSLMRISYAVFCLKKKNNTPSAIIVSLNI